MYRSPGTWRLDPPALETTTSTTDPPVGPGGTRTVSVPADVTVNEAEVEPNLTEVAPEKSNPLTSTVAPPPTGPLDGRTPVITGHTRVQGQVQCQPGGRR